MLKNSQIQKTGESTMRRLPMLLCSIGVFAFAGYVSGATITVTTTEPGINADGLCSFAEAVENVRDGDVHSDCEAGGDGFNIIELGRGETYLQREGVGYAIGIGELTLINGNGSTFDAMDEEDGWEGLVILGDAIINDLTIAGSVSGEGAIWGLFERLSLNRCTIRDSTVGLSVNYQIVLTTDTSFISNASGIVGVETTLIAINTDFLSNHRYAIALWWDSTVTLIGSTVEDNWKGIVTQEVDIRYSTIRNNDYVGVEAKSGSIRNSAVVGNHYGVDLPDEYESNSYTFSIVSSTISGNYTGIIGDTLYPWQGIVYIRDSTITDNGFGTNSFGGGLVHLLDQYVIKNSIIGSNQTNCIYGSGESGSPQSRGFNLTDDDSCGLNHSLDMVVSDVMLSELGDWGGSTPTHMPLEGSHAIDMVKWAGQCSPRDQRGYVRPVDGDDNGAAHCDCGAVEYGAVPPPIPYELEAAAAVDE